MYKPIITNCIWTNLSDINLQLKRLGIMEDTMYFRTHFARDEDIDKAPVFEIWLTDNGGYEENHYLKISFWWYSHLAISTHFGECAKYSDLKLQFIDKITAATLFPIESDWLREFSDTECDDWGEKTFGFYYENDESTESQFSQHFIVAESITAEWISIFNDDGTYRRFWFDL